MLSARRAAGRARNERVALGRRLARDVVLTLEDLRLVLDLSLVGHTASLDPASSMRGREGRHPRRQQRHDYTR